MIATIRWDLVRGALFLLLFLGVVGWRFFRTLKRSEEPERLVVKWIFTGLTIVLILFKIGPVVSDGGITAAAMVPFLAACGVILGIVWAPNVGAIVAGWLGGLYTGGSTPPTPEPHYSVAMALRQRGQFAEAARAVQAELFKFPNDITGHLLLADIQASDMKDLASAGNTILRFCNQTTHAPQTIAVALQTMADYHLKIGVDIDSARQCLEQIIERYPNTELAQRASQRIAHLGTTEDLLNPYDRKPIFLPQGVRYLGLMKKEDVPQLVAEEDPAQQTADLVAHLVIHPMDNDAREHLAILYAEHYHKLDLAEDQLNQLIAQPEQPTRHIVRWLNLLTDLHIRFGEGVTEAQAALQRIIELYPKTAPAIQAEQRLALLANELRGRKETLTVPLGVYEQKIGLRKSQPAK